MLQISPHTEQAQTSPGVTCAETQQQKQGSAKNGLGVFARILAGLLGKPAEAYAATETQNAVLPVETAEQAVAPEGSFLAVETAVSGLTETAGIEQGRQEADLPQAWLPEQENALGSFSALAAGLVSDIPEERTEQTSQNSEPASFAGTIRAGDSAGHIRETANAAPREVPTETVQGDPGAGKNIAAGTVAAQTQATETAENTRNANEPSAEVRAVARETGDGPAVQAETVAHLNTEGVSDDARTRSQRRTSGADNRSAGVQTEAVYRDGPAGQNSVETRLSAEGPGRDIVVELRMPTQNGMSSATTAWESRTMGQVMESMLARELHQHLNGDIVRQASIILRDGSDGVIRLALKPESLGNVKIHLEMAENKITGYIVVESEEALRAFERELASLEKEFRDAGFEGAELKMSLSDGKGADQQGNGTDDGRFISGEFVASRYEASAEMAEISLTPDLYGQGSGTVDMLA
ncbi:MAG: flagellar hook-length control protein FliK [Treponema sp.]|nr:flagellar hook-length control protein FliK [Treponema sp.]